MIYYNANGCMGDIENDETFNEILGKSLTEFIVENEMVYTIFEDTRRLFDSDTELVAWAMKTWDGWAIDEDVFFRSIEGRDGKAYFHDYWTTYSYRGVTIESLSGLDPLCSEYCDGKILKQIADKLPTWRQPEKVLEALSDAAMTDLFRFIRLLDKCGITHNLEEEDIPWSDDDFEVGA